MSSVAVQKYAAGATAVKIAGNLEEAIRAGRIRVGERLPTVRELASALGRSPTTVSAAYARLRGRGLVHSAGRRGTFVSPRAAPGSSSRIDVPAGGRDLRSGNPDPALLPDYRRVLASGAPPPRLYGEDLRYRPLVEIAAEEFAADGIPARRVCVTAGALDAIERVLRLHLAPGDAVAVEDPGFFGVLDLLAGMGLPLVPVRVDDRGPDPDALAASLERGVRGVVLTPRAQNPTGAALDRRRAAALRAVLRPYPDVLVVEDDHAGPIAGSSVHTLGRGRTRWAVVRSVSKALGPDLRVALLAGDDDTLTRVEAQQALGVRWVSHILQRVVAELLLAASTRRLLARAERVYSGRRDALLAALYAHGIAAVGSSGLNVWIPVPEEGEIVAALRERGWAVAPGERFRLLAGSAIRVTISTLSPREARAFARDLGGLLAPGDRAAPA